MKRKRITGFVLIFLFTVFTGIMFFCDFRSSENGTLPEGETAFETAGSYSLSEKAKIRSASSEAGTSEPGSQDEGDFSENESESEIFVYVCGNVKNPDVYRLKSGSRVYEAINAAGGISGSGSAEQLNLADLLSDGEKIYVPAEGETVTANSSAGAATAGSSVKTSPGTGTEGSSEASGNSSLIDINSADSTQLQTLSGIGESRAADIIAYRESNGPFSTVKDIMKVPGIGEGIYAKIESKITCGGK